MMAKNFRIVPQLISAIELMKRWDITSDPLWILSRNNNLYDATGIITNYIQLARIYLKLVLYFFVPFSNLFSDKLGIVFIIAILYLYTTSYSVYYLTTLTPTLSATFLI